VLADSVDTAWRRRIGPSILSPLLVEDGIVVAATGGGRVVALEAATGERAWRRGVGGSVRAGLVRGGEWLLTASERDRGRAFGLRFRDGGVSWAREVGAVVHPPAVAGGTAFFATTTGAVQALDVRTGALIWETTLTAAAAAPPLVHAGALWVATRADTLYALDPATGRAAARLGLPTPVSSGLAVHGPDILVPLHSGELLAYDPAADVVIGRHALGAPILAAPVVSETGEAYVLTSAAEVWRVPAGRAGEPYRVAALGGAARASLAVAGGALLVGRLDGELVALEPDGSVRWRVRLDDSIAAPVTVATDAIYVPLLRGTVVKLVGVR